VIGSVSSNFVDIVITGKRIELGLKSDKIAHGSFAAANPKKHEFYSERKKVEAQEVSTIPYWEVVPCLIIINNLQHNCHTWLTQCQSTVHKLITKVSISQHVCKIIPTKVKVRA